MRTNERIDKELPVFAREETDILSARVTGSTTDTVAFTTNDSPMETEPPITQDCPAVTASDTKREEEILALESVCKRPRTDKLAPSSV